MSMLERAEAAERAMSEELDRTIVKSVIYVSGDRDPRVPLTRPDNGELVMMGQDPRLPRMPERPTLFDFFKYRFGPANHLMQSARLAQKNGVAEKLVLACLLHDIGIAGRSEEHTSELQSLTISYAVFCLKKKKHRTTK